MPAWTKARKLFLTRQSSESTGDNVSSQPEILAPILIIFINYVQEVVARGRVCAVLL